MVWRSTTGLGAAVMLVMGATPIVAQAAAEDSTAVRIRRSAGLPPDSAIGQIEITDVGHNPLATMISIVANRTDAGWSVSYACASSPACSSTEGKFDRAATYVLGPEASTEVDMILEQLRTTKEPERVKEPDYVVGGWLQVSINYHGFKRNYHRRVRWGKILGRLEEVLITPARTSA